MFLTGGFIFQDPFDAHFQNRQEPEVPKTSTSSNKASSTTNIVDDLSSIFGGSVALKV